MTSPSPPYKPSSTAKLSQPGDHALTPSADQRAKERLRKQAAAEAKQQQLVEEQEKAMTEAEEVVRIQQQQKARLMQLHEQQDEAREAQGIEVVEVLQQQKRTKDRLSLERQRKAQQDRGAQDEAEARKIHSKMVKNVRSPNAAAEDEFIDTFGHGKVYQHYGDTECHGPLYPIRGHEWGWHQPTVALPSPEPTPPYFPFSPSSSPSRPPTR